MEKITVPMKPIKKSWRNLFIKCEAFLMHKIFQLRTVYCATLLTFLLPVIVSAENWPHWRGPRLDGTSHDKAAPLHWSSESNVIWKTVLPGLGHASPIVVGEKVFTVT